MFGIISLFPDIVLVLWEITWVREIIRCKRRQVKYFPVIGMMKNSHGRLCLLAYRLCLLGSMPASIYLR